MGKDKIKKFLDKLPKERREKLLKTRIGGEGKPKLMKGKGPDLSKTFHRITPGGDKCDIKGKC